MRRKAWRVLWMDGRAVQYFVHECDAMQFAKDYIKVDSSVPERCTAPKGARIKQSYEGPHPSIKKYANR